ncbi:hypothetical protein [Paenibacillus sp. SI8]|uniref:hypothetical protein n=1 Tax=unclassified Paenibacillus TaxID=185978 RepID=UPI0034669E3C
MMAVKMKFLSEQFRKNPLWFKLLTFAVIVIEATSIFYVKNAYWRSGAQFIMAIFLCACGVKERKNNPTMSAVYFVLAVPFVFISAQTLWLQYTFK